MRTNDKEIVLGDLNAKIRDEVFENITRRFSLHYQNNENGRLLIDLVVERNMVICSTKFLYYIKMRIKTW